ncbi:hypothetical protein [Aerosticca soli]|uniref:hypothetical protein n=1 Tax=Aerosticca soli TaxID=2010829 RepID=UPI0018E083AE|nr:hypothetical protein [Aerosticca soli]
MDLLGLAPQIAVQRPADQRQRGDPVGDAAGGLAEIELLDQPLPAQLGDETGGQRRLAGTVAADDGDDAHRLAFWGRL